MTTLARTLIALLIVVAANCGTGTDGKSVTPPTTPQVAPEPPPEPPEAPTGLRISDRGADFMEWSWNPSPGATGYEAEVFREVGDTEGTHVETREPSYRWTGLEPGVAVSIFVRAVRETAGGRAASPWIGRVTGYTLIPPGPLAPCDDQRDRALAYSWSHTELVHEWNPDRPIRFRVDAGPIIEGGLRIGRPNFLEEELLQPLRDMARRLEERLGYPIMEPDASPSDASRTVTVHWRDRVWSPGWGEPDCPRHIGSPWNAQGTPPAVVLNRYIFDPAITCAAYPRDRDSETIIHELAHVFGMGHAEGVINYVPEDLAMSDRLTRIVGGDSDYFLLIEDLDNIGCVFPHPDFPRGN